MNQVHIFDASALVALFRGYDPVYRFVEDANAERIRLVWPACAIAEANTYLAASHGEWEALLLGSVTIAELTAASAIDVGLLRAERVDVGQVVHEARQTRGLVVTLEPWRYRPWTVPLLVR